MKTLVTEGHIEIEMKNREASTRPNFTNVMLAANDIDALGDLHSCSRRWAVFVCPQSGKEDLLAAGLDNAFFKALYDFLNNDDGFAKIHGYYAAYEIAPYEHPHNLGRAPKTSTIGEVIDYAKSPLESMFEDAITDEKLGFKNGWVCSYYARQILEENGYNTNRIMPKLPQIMKNMGYVKAADKSRIDFGGFTGRKMVTLYKQKDKATWADPREQFMADNIISVMPQAGGMPL